ncbi:MAG: hypothetical protein MJH11_16710, partial [Lentisphaeria bacterium]|nr:hypothetical protein [Lentisphaeria bacterium]
ERVAREVAERQAGEAAEQAEKRLAREEAERIAAEAAEEKARLEREPQERAAPDPPSSPPQSFKFDCGACGQRLKAEADWVGMEIECPACESRLTVPSP